MIPACVSVTGDDCPMDLNKITLAPFNENKNIDDPDFTLIASSSSGLPIMYTSNTNVATVTGNVVHIVGVGTTTITLSQVGNTIYAPASLTQELVIHALTTGTASIAAPENIDLYPNPGSEIISLNFRGNYDEVTIKIFSIDGQEVYWTELESMNNNLK